MLDVTVATHVLVFSNLVVVIDFIIMFSVWSVKKPKLMQLFECRRETRDCESSVPTETRLRCAKPSLWFWLRLPNCVYRPPSLCVLYPERLCLQGEALGTGESTRASIVALCSAIILWHLLRHTAVSCRLPHVHVSHQTPVTATSPYVGLEVQLSHCTVICTGSIVTLECLAVSQLQMYHTWVSAKKVIPTPQKKTMMNILQSKSIKSTRNQLDIFMNLLNTNSLLLTYSLLY